MPQTIILTGANRGIGLGMTRALLAQGDAVAAFDLAGDNVQALAKDSGGRLRFYACDITDARRVQQAVTQTAADFGGVEVVINNACLALFSPFEPSRLPEIRREFEVNYFGALNLIAAVLPLMQAARHGLIYNVSSGVGLTGFPGLTGYTSTKGALESLSRTLRLELAPLGIRVCVLHPPLTRTDSARPLGVPQEMMADPDAVGQKLARQIGRTAPVIAPDLGTAVGLLAMRFFPDVMGRLLAQMTARAQAG